MNELPSQTVNTMIYTLAGLRIVSDLPLPGLAQNVKKFPSETEIVIRHAPVPESLPSFDVAFSGGQCNKTSFLIKVPGVSRFLIRGGKEILVDPVPAASNGDLCAYLLGTVFGVLCHQRGIIPLHASAIDVANGCVAFVGESGAGKSTLVAAFATHGHQVIADDVCFLKISAEGIVKAWPGINRIRLWEDAIAALGYEEAAVERELRGYNKYLLPVLSPPNPIEPRHLRRVYQLDDAPDGSTPSVNRLYGASAVEVLMQNVYRLEFADYMGFKPAAFIACAAVARDVPVFRFSRPRGFNTLRQGLEFLEDHLRDIR